MPLAFSWRPVILVACAAAVGVPLACGSSKDSTFDDGSGDGGDAQASSTQPGFGTGDQDAPSGSGDTDASAQIVMTIRDFRFYDASDPMTDPDFENPPYNTLPDGNHQNGYAGPWDDVGIVTDTLGPDGKPVYASASGHTLTTHGATAFARWFNNIDGGNIWQDIPLVTTKNDAGESEYDSNLSGQPYDPRQPNGSRGFFPIDDGTPTATAFGNQGQTHNYSLTSEIHTIFTYHGGEYFTFRGDDDVWVYIDKHRVIDIGGIHGPEAKTVKLDDLGLTKGNDYPLDFFFAERHVTGSNVLFQTTLALRAAPVIPK